VPNRPKKKRKLKHASTPAASQVPTVDINGLKAVLLEQFLIHFHRLKAELNAEHGPGYAHAHPNVFCDRMNRLAIEDAHFGALQSALHRLRVFKDVARAFGASDSQLNQN
jgi:hypothetical protein